MKRAKSHTAMETERVGDDLILRLAGRIDRHTDGEIVRQLVSAGKKGKSVKIDLSAVEAMDAPGASALQVACQKLRSSGTTVSLLAANEGVKALLRTVPSVSEPPPPTAGSAFLEDVGRKSLDWLEETGELASLLWDIFMRGVIDPMRGRFPSFAQVARESVRIGVDALPIVALIGLLLGLITGFQAAHQLRQFGANIFVANLVGLGMVRELGPLVTAIVMAGRSGSAIAAELGTMTVREEVDALRTMGIDPVRYLVVPKVYAITVTGPALSLFAMAVGVLGGFFIAVSYLDLAPTSYWQQIQQAVGLNDLGHGLGKSLAFSWIVVVVSTFRGLNITGGAVGVGRATTSAVVLAIFLIIATDSVFTTASTLIGG